MRNTLLPILFFVQLYANAQLPNLTTDEVTKKITYRKVVTVDSTITQEQLYVLARQWFAKTFVSSKAVLEMDDRESGTMVAKGILQLHSKNETSSPKLVNREIQILMYFTSKNGKYKFEVTNIIMTYYSGLTRKVENSKKTIEELLIPPKPYPYQDSTIKRINEIDESILKLHKELEDFIANSLKKSPENSW